MQKGKTCLWLLQASQIFQLFSLEGTLLFKEYNYKKGKSNLSANKGTPKIMVTMAPLASKVGRDLVDLLLGPFCFIFKSPTKVSCYNTGYHKNMDGVCLSFFVQY